MNCLFFTTLIKSYDIITYNTCFWPLYFDAVSYRYGKKVNCMDTLYIVIPTYNEEENIEEVITQWSEILKDKENGSKLVIVNDGSTDRTGRILEEQMKVHPELIVLNKKNAGHGPAVYYGYKYAIEHNADFIFQTDSDLQTLPSEFGNFWDMRNDHSAIIGYRPKRGDGKSREMVEKVICLMLKILFGINVSDANAPFRLYKRSKLEIYLSQIDPDYFLPNIILTAYFSRLEKDTAFLPITFLARTKGEQTINLRKIIPIGFRSIKDFAYYSHKIKHYSS